MGGAKAKIFFFRNMVTFRVGLKGQILKLCRCKCIFLN